MKISHINYETKYYYPTFQAYEKTFVMVKPDAFERNLDDTIMNQLVKTDLKISHQWEGIPNIEKVEKLYSQYKQKNFFKEWMDYLANGKIRVMIIEGEDAVNEVLNVKKQVRAEYAPNEKRYNLMHSSDTVDDAKREGGIFFCMA